MQEKFTALIYILWAAAKKRSLQEIVALSMYVVTFGDRLYSKEKRRDSALCAAAAASYQKNNATYFLI